MEMVQALSNTKSIIMDFSSSALDMVTQFFPGAFFPVASS